MTRVVCNEKMSYKDAARRRPNPLIAHGSLLTTQKIRVIRVPSFTFVKKHEKGFFGQRNKMRKYSTLLIIKRMRICKITL